MRSGDIGDKWRQNRSAISLMSPMSPLSPLKKLSHVRNSIKQGVRALVARINFSTWRDFSGGDTGDIGDTPVITQEFCRHFGFGIGDSGDNQPGQP